jgi:hypothetical protein
MLTTALTMLVMMLAPIAHEAVEHETKQDHSRKNAQPMWN